MVDDAKDPAPDVMTFAEFCAFATTYPLQSLDDTFISSVDRGSEEQVRGDFATKC